MMSKRPHPALRTAFGPLAATVFACALVACATPPAWGPAGTDAPPPAVANAQAAATALDAGVRHYEGGRYDAAEAELRRALDLGLTGPGQAVSAHKHLAFVLCVRGEREPCRNEFRQALRVDPSFTLGRAEAGHPMWGPVFREVSSEVRPGAK